MCYHKLYQALLEEKNIPDNFTGIWEKDKKIFTEEQIELENNFLNFDTIIEDEEYTD